MTLTAILPTLRRSLPDPMNPNAWPEHTRSTTTDVVISGVSMLRLVELCETPCVHTGDAVAPPTHRARNRGASAVIVGVLAVIGNCDAERVVLIDGSLETVTALWEEARLIGRASVARTSSAVVLCGDSPHSAGSGRPLELPSDLREGDLIVVPCRGMVSVHDVRPRRSAVDDEPSPGEISGRGVDWLGGLE